MIIHCCLGTQVLSSTDDNDNYDIGMLCRCTSNVYLDSIYKTCGYAFIIRHLVGFKGFPEGQNSK